MVDFHYRGSGDALLLIHGLGSSAAVWSNQRDAFGQDYRFITVELPGHGNNTKAAHAVSIQHTASAISEEIREQRLSRISLVGHSMGGLMAIAAAKENHQSVDRLILMDVPTKQTGIALLNWLFLKTLKKNFQTVVGEQFKKMTDDKLLRETLLETALTTDRNAYYHYMKSLLETDLSSDIKTLDIPIYLFVSSSLVNDRAKLPKALQKYGYAEIPDDRLSYYPQTGHFLMLERADDVNRDLRAILAQ